MTSHYNYLFVGKLIVVAWNISVWINLKFFTVDGSVVVLRFVVPRVVRFEFRWIDDVRLRPGRIDSRLRSRLRQTVGQMTGDQGGRLHGIGGRQGRWPTPGFLEGRWTLRQRRGGTLILRRRVCEAFHLEKGFKKCRFDQSTQNCVSLLIKSYRIV